MSQLQIVEEHPFSSQSDCSRGDTQLSASACHKNTLKNRNFTQYQVNRYSLQESSGNYQTVIQPLFWNPFRSSRKFITAPQQNLPINNPQVLYKTRSKVFSPKVQPQKTSKPNQICKKKSRPFAKMSLFDLREIQSPKSQNWRKASACSPLQSSQIGLRTSLFEKKSKNPFGDLFCISPQKFKFPSKYRKLSEMIGRRKSFLKLDESQQEETEIDLLIDKMRIKKLNEVASVESFEKCCKVVQSMSATKQRFAETHKSKRNKQNGYLPADFTTDYDGTKIEFQIPKSKPHNRKKGKGLSNYSPGDLTEKKKNLSYFDTFVKAKEPGSKKNEPTQIHEETEGARRKSKWKNLDRVVNQAPDKQKEDEEILKILQQLHEIHGHRTDYYDFRKKERNRVKKLLQSPIKLRF